jgi:hypothetical protein
MFNLQQKHIVHSARLEVNCCPMSDVMVSGISNLLIEPVSNPALLLAAAVLAVMHTEKNLIKVSGEDFSPYTMSSYTVL